MCDCSIIEMGFSALPRFEAYVSAYKVVFVADVLHHLGAACVAARLLLALARKRCRESDAAKKRYTSGRGR